MYPVIFCIPSVCAHLPNSILGRADYLRGDSGRVLRRLFDSEQAQTHRARAREGRRTDSAVGRGHFRHPKTKVDQYD